MSQSKKFSLIESIVNVVIGYTINFTAQIFIFPVFGVYISTTANLEMGAIFTIISIVRSYTLRRMFNLWHNR